MEFSAGGVEGALLLLRAVVNERATVRLAWITGASAAVLACLDLLGLTDPERPPLAVAVLDLVAILAAVGILIVITRGSARTA